MTTHHLHSLYVGGELVDHFRFANAAGAVARVCYGDESSAEVRPTAVRVFDSLDHFLLAHPEIAARVKAKQEAEAKEK